MRETNKEETKMKEQERKGFEKDIEGKQQA